MTARAWVRWEAVEPNPRGHHPGVFALVNGLGRAGLLRPADEASWRAGNAWFGTAVPDPALRDPALFDRSRLVACWFATSAVHVIERVRPYLDLLDRHGVAWREVHTDDPGEVLYADDVQIVAVRATRTGGGRCRI